MAIFNASNDFASNFSAVIQAAARPTFELNFAILQNSLLNQLDDEIEVIQNRDINRVDAFLTVERNQLTRALQAVGRFGNDTQHNNDVLRESLEKVEELIEADGAGNATEFNKLVGEIDELFVESIRDVSGAAAGLNVRDGFYPFKETGSTLSNFEDYADDASRSEAVLNLQSRLLGVFAVQEVNLNTAFRINTDIESRLASIDLQITADQAAAQVEAIQEIEKLQQDFSQYLTAISLAFEVGQAAAQQLADAIQNPDRTKGTVVDIIS